MYYYSGITINEVYNCYVNYYYLSMVKIEFLIFFLINLENKNIILYDYLDNVFNNKIINYYRKIGFLEESVRNEFNETWLNLVEKMII